MTRSGNTADYLAIFSPYRELMMSDTTRAQLPTLLTGLHDMLACELGIARLAIGHSGTKGTVSEGRWIEMLRNHLPTRYQVSNAFVIDSRNQCSDQIDIVIHDRQYSPFVLKYDPALYVPAESVYAVFEVKQEMTVDELKYASQKVASVRRLYRTSLPIPHAGGTYPPKLPERILGGLLCLKSSWSPPFGDSFHKGLKTAQGDERLDLGCAVQDGVFEVIYLDGSLPSTVIHNSEGHLAFFLLRLIARLQFMATVPSLDVMAYARWLQGDDE